MTENQEQKEIPQVDSVGIVIIQDGKVLLVKHGEKAGHKNDVYGTPAGRVEAGEGKAAAALRELEEETGLRAELSDLQELPRGYIADIERKSGEVVRFNHTVFRCDKFTGELRANDEVTPEWIAVDKISELDLLPNVEDMIKQTQAYASGILND